MGKGKAFVAMILVVGVVATLDRAANAANATDVAFAGCRSTDECASGQCCVIGANRYSVPRCTALQGEGEMCRPSATAMVNATFFYPDAGNVTIKDVHFILCPCADDLACDRQSGLCQRSEA